MSMPISLIYIYKWIYCGSYLRHCSEFEALANGILKFCWDKDRQYTSDMLVRVAPNWGNSTVLSMAHSAEMEEFLAQPACYTKLNKIWRGDIALRTNIFWVSQVE